MEVARTGAGRGRRRVKRVMVVGLWYMALAFGLAGHGSERRRWWVRPTSRLAFSSNVVNRKGPKTLSC